MGDLPESLDDLLRDVVAGDRTIDDPEVVHESERNPRFAERLRELSGVDELLGATFRDMQETIEEAAASEKAPGEDSLAAAVLGSGKESKTRAQHRFEDVAPMPRGRIVAIVSGLAALFLAVALYLNRSTPEQPVWMGEGELQIDHPRGAVESFQRLAWKGELPAGGEFQVRVWNTSDAAPGTSPVLLHHTIENHWEPNPDELAGLTDRITIEVSSHSVDGSLVEVARSTAER